MFVAFLSPTIFLMLGAAMMFAGGVMIGRATMRFRRPRLEFDLG